MAEEIPFRREMIFEYGIVRELMPGVQRLVANNPGPFTFKGTNTYILGSGQELMLIDPGPTDDVHYEAIVRWIEPRRLSTILITHTHRDHIDGLDRLVVATGAKTCGFGRVAADPGRRKTSASGGEDTDQSFRPDTVLEDGGRIEGEGFSLTAIHTPGHAPDHLCFALEGTGALFSGDHVMSWNTSVVAPPEDNMMAYMRSLDRLVKRDDDVYFPGHGGRLTQPQRVVKAFILHRRMREEAILTCIREGRETIAEIVPIVYRGLDSRLLNAASLSVAAHVESLVERGLVLSTGPLTKPDRLSAV